jgi:hypothetical protein
MYGRWTHFEPTPEEAKAIDVFMIQSRDYEERRLKIPRSRQIFYTCAGFAFALVGSIAGRVLSDRALPPARSSEPQPLRQSG